MKPMVFCTYCVEEVPWVFILVKFKEKITLNKAKQILEFGKILEMLSGCAV